MNILVLDDEKEIADLVEVYLKNENYNVYKYYSSEHIMNDLENIKIDLAILDIMMPGVDGFSLCEEIRKKYNFPIIFVTAKVENIDKISGFAIGADDYVTKPFEPLELVARVKAQIRRYKNYNKVEENEEVINQTGQPTKPVQTAKSETILVDTNSSTGTIYMSDSTVQSEILTEAQKLEKRIHEEEKKNEKEQLKKRV